MTDDRFAGYGHIKSTRPKHAPLPDRHGDRPADGLGVSRVIVWILFAWSLIGLWMTYG